MTVTREEVNEKKKQLFHDWKKTVGRLLCELDEAWQCIEDAEAEVRALHDKIVFIANEHKLPLHVNSILVKVKKTVPKVHDADLAGTYNWEFILSALSNGDRAPSDNIGVKFESIPSPFDNAVNDTVTMSSVYENKFGGQALRDITSVEFDELEAEYNLF